MRKKTDCASCGKEEQKFEKVGYFLETLYTTNKQ